MQMKKNVFTLLAGTALLCACQPAQKETTISGTLTGIESDTLLVLNAPMPTASNENNQSKTDTVAMQDGKFTLTLACDSEHGTEHPNRGFPRRCADGERLGG